MGVYGDFLGVFSELFEWYDVVKCEPKIGGGYITTPIKKIHGYIQDGESGLDVRDSYSRSALSSGTGAGIVSELNICYLYTREEPELFTNFIMYKGSPYRPMSSSNYQKEGSFVVTELHKVVGDASVNTKITEIVAGTFD